MIYVQPTELATWQTLVLESQARCGLSLHEDLEHYLVSLLMRTVKHSGLANSAVGYRLLNALQNARGYQSQQLREVGDECLLIAGLFPDRIYRRRVSLGYFFDVGQCAYSALSDGRQNTLSGLYDKLCLEFGSLVDVLHGMRDYTQVKTGLLQAMDIWQLTGSSRALRMLNNSTKSKAIPLKLTRT